MLKTRKIIKIEPKDKEMLRTRIDFVFGIIETNNYQEIKKVFGKGTAMNIDDIITTFHYNMWILGNYNITYLMIYEKMEKDLNFIFDVSFDNITDCHFGSKGSLYPDTDNVVIDVPWRIKNE